MSKYEALPVNDNDDDDDDDINFDVDYYEEENDIELTNVGMNNNNNNDFRKNMILSGTNNDDYNDDNDDNEYNNNNNNNNNVGEIRIPISVQEERLLQDSFFRLEDPWFISILIMLFVTIPYLIFFMYRIMYQFTGTIWSCTFVVFHIQVLLFVAKCKIPSNNIYNNDYDDNDDTITTTATTNNNNHQSIRRRRGQQFQKKLRYYCYYLCINFITIFGLLFDILMFGYIYPFIYHILTNEFYTDVDGEIIIDWSDIVEHMIILKHIGFYICIGLQCCIYSIAFIIRIVKWYNNNTNTNTTTTTNNNKSQFLLYWRPSYCNFFSSLILIRREQRNTIRSILYISLKYMNRFIFIILLWCIFSIWSHFFSWPIPSSYNKQPYSSTHNSHNNNNNNNNNHHIDCDPLDTTECILPFPSFHHMVQDNTTTTGYRVNLKSHLLPPLRSTKNIFFSNKNNNNNNFDLSSWNEMDGFSTIGPILFYINGLKEAHENRESFMELQNLEQIKNSITSKSITLLLDVKKQKLIYHSTEIDYLDEMNPICLLFPAEPLQHNTHYAVIVVNAADRNGHTIQPTNGLLNLFHQSNNNIRKRYIEQLIPSLEIAAPWISFTTNSKSIQLLFDFHTISSNSQIGKIRKLRDSTLNILNNNVNNNNNNHKKEKKKTDTNNNIPTATTTTITKWDWKNHARIIKTIDNSNQCDDVTTKNNAMIARTIHAEIDVPWYLSTFGPGGRTATIDPIAVQTGIPVTYGQAKVIIQVPCSIRKAIIIQQQLNTTYDTNRSDGGKPLQAIVEYGHGLFYSRQEVQEEFLSRMANNNGYILMAMDWRGMSAYDLPIVIKTLLSTPSLFHSICDNIIQGYINKLALQHFSQNGMLEMDDWFQFDSIISSNNHDDEHPTTTKKTTTTTKASIPTINNKRPESIFYGISQGGILGGGYVAFTGITKLIDRGILGVPGTPFALVMTRSLDFTETYDLLLLRNFYTNRHVRIFLSLAQMQWDTVEASGLLARPVTEPFPRMLLQAGLGDSIVPTSAAETLARAYGAITLPNSPRKIFGIETIQSSSSKNNNNSSISNNNDDDDDGPYYIHSYDKEKFSFSHHDGSDNYNSNSTTLTTTTTTTNTASTTNGQQQQQQQQQPYVTFTELLYEKEYNSLPIDNKKTKYNPVHICVRLDDKMQQQVIEFINTGNIIDPCKDDYCRREQATC